MNGDIIFYQFSRSAIQEGDFTDFLKRFGKEVLPKGQQLADMMNSFATFVNGYDHDPREVYAIPEVRTFYARLVHAWPYWLYFSNLETESLMMLVMCCLKSLDAVAVRGQSHSKVLCDPLELLDFVRRHLEPMNEMCERAGMSEQALYDRSKRVFDYFGLPWLASGPG